MTAMTFLHTTFLHAQAWLQHLSGFNVFMLGVGISSMVLGLLMHHQLGQSFDRGYDLGYRHGLERYHAAAMAVLTKQEEATNDDRNSVQVN